MATIRNPNRKRVKALPPVEEALPPPPSENIEYNADGGATVTFSEEDLDQGLGEYDQTSGHYENLVSKLDPEQELKIAMQVIANVQADEASRNEWMRTMQFGLSLIGTKIEEKNEPFEGACSAQHPLLMESAVKFQSKASNELLPAAGPVKCKIMGDVTPEKEQQANRVKAHMNYQITEEMTEFYVDSERLLLYIALVGSGFKKTYYNGHLERPCSEFIPVDQFLVPNNATDLYRANRYTHILYKTEYELDGDCAAGLYEKPEDGIGFPQTRQIGEITKKTNELMGMSVSLAEQDKVYTLYEQHIMICIEGLDEENEKYKLASPYIITVDLNSKRVIGLRRNWKEGDSKRKKKVQFTHYSFVPSFNFYSYGFLHLLGNLQLTLTSSLRSLVDAGQFANLQGGFKLKGVRITGSDEPIRPGQFKDLECAVQDINKALMVMPFKEPSGVLYQMLEFLDRKGQQFADSTEQVIADSTNYGPVGTTMALLEASTKFFSAIHKRLHNALKNELKIIADINSETLPDDTEYNLENETMKIARADYGPSVAVIPVSDPNIPSAAHRLAKAQALHSTAIQSPEVHNMREILKQVYTAMDIPNLDKILPPPEEAQQQDPMSDIMSAQQGKPIKAFPGQDHKTHIAIKQSFLQDPNAGQNPTMQKVAAQIQANIQEHIVLQFVEQVKAQAQGATDEQALAQAATQVAQMNQKQLQQQMEQAQMSPRDQAALILAQAEMKDTEIKAAAQVAKAEVDRGNLILKAEEIDIKKAQVMQKGMQFDKAHEQEMDKLVTSVGLDAMIADLSQENMHKAHKELEMIRAANKPKPTEPKNE